MRLHLLHIPSALAALVVIVVQFRMISMHASSAEVTAYTYCILGNLVYIPLLIAWSTDVDGLLVRFMTSRETPAKIKPDPVISKFGSPTRRLQLSSDSSFKHNQQQLLYIMAIPMGMYPLGSWWTVGLLWIFRMAMLAMLVSASDRPCTYSELKSSEPSFGLVVDAFHIREAICAHLRSEAYSGPLTMTRATYYRMHDTLTVSYRLVVDTCCLAAVAVFFMSVRQMMQMQMTITTIITPVTICPLQVE